MSDLASNVYDIIARCGRVDRAAVQPDATLADLKIESLSGVEIIFALEGRGGSESPVEANQQQLKFDTVGDVVSAVEGLIAAKRAGA